MDMYIKGVDTLPRRRFIDVAESSWHDYLDEHGLLSETAVSRTMGVQDLFLHSAVLVVAPPWTGKTHVAKQLSHYLDAARAFLHYMCRLCR